LSLAPITPLQPVCNYTVASFAPGLRFPVFSLAADAQRGQAASFSGVGVLLHAGRLLKLL